MRAIFVSSYSPLSSGLCYRCCRSSSSSTPLRNCRAPPVCSSSSFYSSSSPLSSSTYYYCTRPILPSFWSFWSESIAGCGGGCRYWAGIHPLLRMERFSTSGTIDKNKALVHQLQQYGVIRSKQVAEVMETIDRGLFVPHGNPPYVDTPMQIGYNATISAPHMHAMCLELLKEHLQPGMHALDIGSGTGYLTACFAMMVGPQGRAVGVEHIPELVASSIENIKRSAAKELLEGGSLSVHVADGRLGWPELAPYDAIHVGAAAPDIPQPLIDQLKPGGRMVIPVGNIFQDLKVVDKNLDGIVSIRNETSVRYVPLTSKAAQLHDY